MFDQPPPGVVPPINEPQKPAPPPPSSPGRPIPTTEPIDMLEAVEPASAPTPTPSSQIAPDISAVPSKPAPLPPLSQVIMPSKISDTNVPPELSSVKKAWPWKTTIIAAVIVLALGGGAFAAYTFRDSLFGSAKPAAPAPADKTPEDIFIPEETPPPPPPPLVLDTDSDGLLDEQETQLGTDPQNPDTDGDELFDGEEVNAHHTDPLNADTDGDSYRDGAEVKAGYNPNGPGRLYEIPSE